MRLPGDTLEQHVPAGEQADEQPLEHRVLPDDHALDLVQGLAQSRARLGAQLVGVFDFDHLFSLLITV